MNLVICSTPLHLLEVESLARINEITDFELFCYSNETPQIKYYFDKLNNYTIKSTNYIVGKSFPGYVIDLYFLFYNKEYENVYFASVDNVFIHFILSFIKFKKIITFDDGNANVIHNSMLYIDDRKWFKKILYKLFFCNYDLNKTLKLISKHYSIYSTDINISSNIVNFKLDFNVIKKCGDLNKLEVANVFLGTVYNDATTNIDKFMTDLGCFLKATDFFYIPHPRDNKKYFSNVTYLDGVEIAEHKIISLLSKYKRVNVFGFNSSAQLNIDHIDNINNYVLKSTEISEHLDFELEHKFKEIWI